MQLANRRALDEALPLAWAQAQQRRRPLALLMIDIDHFKAYNDHYGHVGGDHCLQQVAAALATATQRQGELVARYGGEEFAVLLPDADSAQARVTAQRLCATVRALALGKPQRVINVTDDTEMKAGDYFDAAADLYGLPRPQRLPRAELQAAVTGMQWSFLRESRRLRNARMKRELRLVLRHPQVLDGLRDLQME